MQQMLRRRRLSASVLALVAASALGFPALAQKSDYPHKSVTILVGFTAGGPTDVVARILADHLSRRFNQPFIIDNRPGASGGLAAGLVKKAPADGYTLMIGSSSTLSIIPHVQKNIQYDPIKDFTPIALVASYPYFLVVPATSSIRTYEDLISKGREGRPELSYASAGNGAVNHLAGEWFNAETGIRAVHIPYRGDSAVISDLIAGRVDFAFIAGAAALPQVKADKLRIIASASAVPGRGAQGIPTLGVDKIKGFVAEPWNGLMGPAGTPRQVVTLLNAAVNEIMNSKEVVQKLAAMEQYPFAQTPEGFGQYIQEQSQRWAALIKQADIKVQ